MSDEPFHPDSLIDPMALLLRLEIAPEYRAGIVTNLEATARFAALVLDFPIDDHVEPAPVFRP